MIPGMGEKSAMIYNKKITAIYNKYIQRRVNSCILAVINNPPGREVSSADGMPDWVRTSDLQSRSLTLYPAELRAHGRLQSGSLLHCNGVSENCQDADLSGEEAGRT